ncbi:hypothetical protein M1555_00365 [Patescibacteria group bacterium]|nr:hypothetical protein [Patescibacteria group bacterium]
MKRFTFPQEHYHFSVDDVFNCLIEVSDQKIDLFDHPFFRFLLHLHDAYGASIDLYLFYQSVINGSLRMLTEVSGRLKTSLSVNPWLRFGPHALDYATAPYAQKPESVIPVFDAIYSCIDRFASSSNLSKLVRLHYFSELYELADYFEGRGVRALFSTDKEIFSHRMPDKNRKSLQARGTTTYKGMSFVRSQFRVEYWIRDYLSVRSQVRYLGKLFDTYRFITFFTHECDMSNEDVRNAIELILNECHKRRYVSI